MADLISGSPDVAASVPARDRRTDEWAPLPRVRTYELVLQRIEAQIVSGALRAGERLPPERELADLLGVSRPAVREALRVLEAQGAVRSQVGQGPDSGTTIDRVPSDALTRLLRLHVALGSFPLVDVIETRVTLERSIAILACRNARPQNIVQMRAILLAMDEPEITKETFNQLDIDFHVELAEAGGNRLMCDMTRAIRESVRVPFLAAVTAMPETGRHSWPNMLDSLRAEHHAVLRAFEAGDGEKAADLLESHIRGFYKNVTAATSPVRGDVPASRAEPA
jgi:GntR family transcriptional regulator, transcriptional repressor for pyruvate dehydrogenase complex